MSRLPSIQFNRIREHEGSQHRAWEELTYQLAHDLDDLPDRTILVRRGTPDGGVEFHCEAPPGRGTGTWAWQAKYLFDSSQSTFDQMTGSFRDALANTPGLTRYTFVLPKDRPAGAAGESAMKMSVGRLCLQRAGVARTVRRWPDEGTVMDAHDHIE